MEKMENIEDLIDTFENTGDNGNFFIGDYSNIEIAIYLRKQKEEIERLNKENEYLNNKHEKIIHNIMEFVDKNTFNHRNTGERILTLHGKGILDLLDICLGSDKE